MIKRKWFSLVAITFLTILIFITLTGASIAGNWDFSEGAPPEYFVGRWVLQDPAPSIVIDIQEYLGSTKNEYQENDFFRGEVIYPGDSVVGSIIIDQIPDYIVNENHVPDGQDPNVIVLRRYGNFSSLFLRALKKEDDYTIAIVELMNQMQSDYEDNCIELMEVLITFSDGRRFVNEDDIKLIRE